MDRKIKKKLGNPNPFTEYKKFRYIHCQMFKILEKTHKFTFLSDIGQNPKSVFFNIIVMMITVMLMNVHKNVVAGMARVVTFVPTSYFKFL